MRFLIIQYNYDDILDEEYKKACDSDDWENDIRQMYGEYFDIFERKSDGKYTYIDTVEPDMKEPREYDRDTDIDLTEMNNLAKGLDKKGVKYTYRRIYDGGKIDCGDWNAICHSGSHGGNMGLLEVYGLIAQTDCDSWEVPHEGYLKSDDILKRL